MRTILFATAAILGMTAGTAMAERAPIGQQEIAAVVPANGQFDRRDGTIAGNGLPDVQTNRQSPQYAAGGGNHPNAETNEHGTQYAAAGGNHPQSETNEHGTQYAASGSMQLAAGRYPGADNPNRG
jgi:hypothetical protein